MARAAQANVVAFPGNPKKTEKRRKSGLNNNREGSVRKVNDKVYVDFIYLDERVRESSGLPWNEKNAKRVREELDSLMVEIKNGTFKFAKYFPQSKQVEAFSKKECELAGDRRDPNQVLFGEYALEWAAILGESNRVTDRTLLEYRKYLDLYLIPFFGHMPFDKLNATTIERFILWAGKQKYKGKSVGNKSINKYLVPMKMICKQAAIEYQWGSSFDPFFGHKRLKEDDAIEKIRPFSIEEQRRLHDELPDHWKPYFDFAFRSGLRPGEQIGLKPIDIDWENGVLQVQRAITLDRNGKRTEGKTKNRHSRRTIKLTPPMKEALAAQREIQKKLGSEYFFCTPSGCAVHLNNVRKSVWIPALDRAGLPIREMKQTRHSFATTAISCGEDPLWVARVMGHRDIEMVVKTYSRYVANNRGTEDGSKLSALYGYGLPGTPGNAG